jgi:hypothetical protein
MSSEECCEFVSSRGILKSCSIHSKDPESDYSVLSNYNDNFINQKDGTTIYICSRALLTFVRKIYLMNFRFILVTGDSDITIPNEILNQEDFLAFISNEKLIHWYSQNCFLNHPKLSRIPIGLDYHTIHKGHALWGGITTPIVQEQQLHNLREKMNPFWDRKIMCYSNFHFRMYDSMKFGYKRTDTIRDVSSDLVYYEPIFLKRYESWIKQSKYAFVISPHGNGLDCHRTWEAILLGCIPIVKKSSIDSLYEDLPVLIVDEWTDVTKELLMKTIIEFKDKSFLYERLYLKYWMDKIKKY